MRRRYSVVSTAWLLGLGLIQIAIAIGIGIDFGIPLAAGRKLFPDLASPAAGMAQHGSTGVDSESLSSERHAVSIPIAIPISISILGPNVALLGQHDSDVPRKGVLAFSILHCFNSSRNTLSSVTIQNVT